MHKTPFHISSIKSTRTLEFVYSDVWGPSPIDSIDGFKYYLIFVDHYTKYIWLYPMKRKSEVSQFSRNLKILWKNSLTILLFLFTLTMVVNLFI